MRGESNLEEVHVKTKLERTTVALTEVEIKSYYRARLEKTIIHLVSASDTSTE